MNLNHRVGFVSDPLAVYFECLTPDGSHQHPNEVLIPDWPGHGRSGALDLKTLTSEQTCEALATLISTVDGPVVLLAHSMGAAFGWRIAELCGNKILAIVGIATTPPCNIQHEPEILSESEEGLVLRTQFRTLTWHKEGAVLATSPFVKDRLVGNSIQFPLDRLDAMPNCSRIQGRG